jgi:hypothetical protein
MQSVLITANVVSSNLGHSDLYSIQAVRWFSLGTSISFTNKTDRHDIAEILLKVALNTITLTLLLTDIVCLYKCDYYKSKSYVLIAAICFTFVKKQGTLK